MSSSCRLSTTMSISIALASIIILISVSINGQTINQTITDAEIEAIFGSQNSSVTSTSDSNTPTVPTLTNEEIKAIFGSQNSSVTPTTTDSNTTTVEQCECVPYYLCDRDLKIVTDGQDLIDMRDNPKVECNSLTELCCKLPHILKPEQANTSSLKSESNTTTVATLTDEEIKAIFGSQNSSVTPTTDSNATTVEQCECVPYYLCDRDLKIVTDGQDLIDFRETPEECESPIELCCKLPRILKPEQVNTSLPEKFVSKGCGHRNEKGVGVNLVGNKGNETQYGEFPWVIALFQRKGNKLEYFCAGSLIHKQVVLTAAHCLDRLEGGVIVARAGEWDLEKTNELISHQDVQVKDTIIHEKYVRKSNATYDIALLQLQQPFNLTNTVDIVCLPYNDQDISDSKSCFGGGWGKDKTGVKGVRQPILKKVTLEMVPHDKCENEFRKTRLSKYFNLHESFVCAGGPEADLCMGDGGSPLICPIPALNGKYKQVGITSWGIGCKNGSPGAYANVPYFKKWIDTKMTELKFNPLYDYAL